MLLAAREDTALDGSDMQEASPAASKGFTASLPAIDECFRHDSVEEIYAALEARGGDWAQQTLKQLKA